MTAGPDYGPDADLVDRGLLEVCDLPFAEPDADPHQDGDAWRAARADLSQHPLADPAVRGALGPAGQVWPGPPADEEA